VSQTVINRGCVQVPDGEGACEVVRKDLEVTADAVDECDICLTDRCNGSTSLKVSLGAMVLLLTMGLKNLL